MTPVIIYLLLWSLRNLLCTNELNIEHHFHKGGGQFDELLIS